MYGNFCSEIIYKSLFSLQFDTLLQYTRIVSMVEKTTSTLPEQTWKDLIQWNIKLSKRFHWRKSLWFDSKTASFFQVCFIDVGQEGAASGYWQMTTRIVCHPHVQGPQMGLSQLKDPEARCEAKGSRHVCKSPSPVERHSWDILGQGLPGWTESEETNNWENDQSWIPRHNFCHIFPTSQCLVEGEEGKGCTWHEDKDHVCKIGPSFSRLKGWAICQYEKFERPPGPDF